MFKYVLRGGLIFILIAVLVAVSMWSFKSVSIPLTIAVPPLSASAQRSLQTVGREVGNLSRWVTINRLNVPDFATAAKELETGDAKLAILRADIAFPANAQTIAILRTERVFLIVPANSQIEKFSQLRNKTVAILPGPAQDGAILDTILTHQEVPLTSVTRVPMAVADVGKALQQKKIVAVFVVGTPAVGASAEAYAAVAKATKGTPSIIGVQEAESIAKRFAGLETSEIPEGAFGGSNAQPDETLTTIAVSQRLAARKDMLNIVAGELTRVLFEAKARLALQEPGVTEIAVPDLEDTRFSIHPGAKAFYDGAAPTLFDRFESIFWVSSAMLGILGSMITWMLRKVRRQRGQNAVVDRLLAFIHDVRIADRARLEELEDELDGIFTRLVEAQSRGKLEEDEFTVGIAALEHARRAIDHRDDALRRLAEDERSAARTDGLSTAQVGGRLSAVKGD